jgi:hypothetical protein
VEMVEPEWQVLEVEMTLVVMGRLRKLAKLG